MQSTGEKQQFTWTNKMVDELISTLENFMEFMLTKTDKYKKRSYMKNCKNYGGFGTKELLKIENDDGKTDL